jgi:hypothetical protein
MDWHSGYISKKMIDKKSLKKSIALPLENVGFVKKGQTWYLDSKDVISVVNLQKCDWGEWYFINVGIWLKVLEEGSFPKESECHLNYRAESLFPDQRELILLGCHLEMSNPEILVDLAKFIENQLIPFLDECREIKKLRELMAQGKLNNGIVWKEARKYLSENNQTA